MTSISAIAIAEVLVHHAAIAGSLTIISQDGNVFTVADIDGEQYLVTVESMYVPTDGPTDTEVWQKCPDRDNYSSAREHARKCGAHSDSELPEGACLRLTPDSSCPAAGSPRCKTCTWEPADDDGDDDEIAADPENFDGGFGNGSWFQESMRKTD